MKAVAFPQANKVLKAPPGQEAEVYDLPVWVGEVEGVERCISCWEATPEERARIAAGGPVWLWVVGHTHPPLVLDAASLFEPAQAARPTVAESFRDLLDRQKLTPEEQRCVDRASEGDSCELGNLLAIIARLTGEEPKA